MAHCSMAMAWRWRSAGACPSVGRVGSSMMQQQPATPATAYLAISPINLELRRAITNLQIDLTLDFRTPSALISQGREQSACRSTSAFSSVHVTYCTVGQEVPRQMLLCTRYRRGRHYMYQFHRVARGPITEGEAHRQQLWPYSGAAPRNHQPGTLVTLMASASTMTTIRTAPAPVVHHRHRYQP